MHRRPHPGPAPSPAARLAVGRALLRVLVQIVGQGCSMFTFAFTRDRWRREIAERVREGAQPKPVPLPAGKETP